MKIETALKLAKPFVGSLRSVGSRPILKTALVTETHVIATDSHRLIRIKHDEEVTEPYLHHYKKFEKTENLEARVYPKTERLFPELDYATTSGPLDTKEMMEAIEGACVAAEFNAKVDYDILVSKNSKVPKHLKKTADQLKKDARCHVRILENKLTVKPNVKDFETGEFTYTFDKALPIPEETAFNPEYLKAAFKVFKSEKIKTIGSYFYTNMRPWLLVAGDIEIIILPVRVG